MAGAARPRVVFLITQFRTGGAQRALLDRVARLHARMDCIVLVLCDDTGYMLDALRATGAQVEVLGLERTIGVLERLATLRARLEQLAPDAVSGSLVWDHTYGLAAAVLAGVPLTIADVQNTKANGRANPLGLRLAERVMLTFCADRVVACSAAVLDSYGGDDRWTVVPNGVDTAPLHLRAAAAAPGADARAIVVGTLGRLSRSKNQALLVRAFARVAARHPTAVLRIAGGPDDAEADVRRAIDESGVRGRIFLEGEVADPAAFLASLDVFALSSDWEGLPLVVMEALALGKAVVATRAGGTGGLISHGRTGLLCPPGDLDAFADALARLIADNSLRQRLGRCALAASTAFDTRHTADAWERVLADGLEGSRARRHGPSPASRPHGARVLVFATCSMPRLRSVVADVQDRWPGSAIEFISSRARRDALAAAWSTAAVHTYAGHRFTSAALGWRRLFRLRGSRYSAVVIPYNDAARADYGRVERAARFIAGDRVVGYAAWQDRVLYRGFMSVPAAAVPIDLARNAWGRMRRGVRARGGTATGSPHRHVATPATDFEVTR